MGFGCASKGKKTFFYVGPMASIKLTKHLSTAASLTKDVWSNSKMYFWKTNYNFGSKKQPSKK